MHEETACTVAGIDYDLAAGERLFLAGALADLIHQNVGIYAHEIDVLASAVARFCKIAGFGYGDHFLDIRSFQAAFLDEEFEAVAVKGQMAGRNHDGAVIRKAGGDGGHKHRRRGSQAGIKECHTHICRRFLYAFQNARPGDTGITANADAQALLADPLRQPGKKAAGELVDCLVRQIYVLAFDALAGHAADIAFVAKFFQIHILSCSSLAGKIFTVSIVAQSCIFFNRFL